MAPEVTITSLSATTVRRSLPSWYRTPVARAPSNVIRSTRHPVRTVRLPRASAGFR